MNSSLPSCLAEFDCSEEIVSIIAMMQIQDVFLQPSGGHAKHAAEVIKRKFAVEEGDHMTMLNVYTAFIEVSVQHTAVIP